MENSESGSAWKINNIKIAVVDDEREWRSRTVREIQLILGEGASISEYESGDALIESGAAYDLIFLDIEMPGRDGFETAIAYRGFCPNALIALLTTHTEYWKMGYAVNVFRYLEKANMREDIRETLAACRTFFKKHKVVDFSIPKKPSLKVRVDNIIYIEAKKPNVYVYTKQGLVISNESFKDAISKIDDEAFAQCHRSYIVNMEEIKQVNEDRILLKNGEELILSLRRRKDFVDTFMKYMYARANR